MTKYFQILLIPFIFSGCFFNQTGISAKYYANECNEYYDVQGFYHKECKNENFINYKEVTKKTQETTDFAIGVQEE